MELVKRQIIDVLECIDGYRGLPHERQADAILEIPEIAQALKRATVSTTTFPDVKFGAGTVILPDGSTIERKA